jgi:hypothetical protein
VLRVRRAYALAAVGALPSPAAARTPQDLLEPHLAFTTTLDLPRMTEWLKSQPALAELVVRACELGGIDLDNEGED